MQSLCTLRDHCRQWPRNTRYQADATPYLGRTSTGWIAPALPGALIQSLRPRQRQCLRYCEAEGFRGLKLTTSSNFTVPPTQRKIASRRRFCRLGGTSPCRSFPARGGLSLDARPWLPGAAEVSSAPHHGGRCARPCRSSRCRLSAEDGRHGSINRTVGIRVVRLVSAVQNSAEECPAQQSPQPPAARMEAPPSPELPPEPVPARVAIAGPAP